MVLRFLGTELTRVQFPPVALVSLSSINGINALPSGRKSGFESHPYETFYSPFVYAGIARWSLEPVTFGSLGSIPRGGARTTTSASAEVVTFRGRFYDMEGFLC